MKVKNLTESLENKLINETIHITDDESLIRASDYPHGPEDEPWDFPVEELEYLMQEHDGETFVLVGDRLYEAQPLMESLNEAVNHENDEINALLRKYVGKKNISAKDRKTIEAAGIRVEDVGDRIRFIGPHGKQLSGWGRTDRQGPKRPMRHSKYSWRRKEDAIRSGTWDLSTGRGWGGEPYYKNPEGDSWDKVDLKGYLDSDRDPEWLDYYDYRDPGFAGKWADMGSRRPEAAKSLRPYSDEYKQLRQREERAKWSRDYNRRNYGILSDDELEDKVREFRDQLAYQNERSKVRNKDAEDEYDKAVSDVDSYLKGLGVRK